jgi:UDPglucose 6-dehydrogenase
MGHVKAIYGDRVSFASSQYEALKGADALVICTEWNEFRTPDFDRIASQLNMKVIFDGRNLYDVAVMVGLGFHYESVGRKAV